MIFMQEWEIILDNMTKKLIDIDKRKKEIKVEESRIKEEIKKMMKLNNLSSWTFEKGSITHHKRISYSNWNMSSIITKIGQKQFNEIIQIKIGVLKEKLTINGISPEKHDDYLSTIATPKIDEWIRLNKKKTT